MRSMLIAGLLSIVALSAAHAQDRIRTQPEPDEDEIVVPGVQRPVPAPPGDPRTDAQRMRDIRAWDRCVIYAENFGERDPMKYQPQSPEEYCRQRLGMADRLGVPISRD